MKKTIIYKYLGTNGTIESPVHLEDIYYIRLLYLEADKDKVLTNGIEQYKTIKIPEEELNQWSEIGQN